MGLSAKAKNIFTKATELLKLNFAKIYFSRRKKHLAIFFTIFIFVGVGLVIPRGIAMAGIIDWIGTGLLSFVYFVIYYIFWFLFYVAYLVAWIGAGSLSINLNPEIMNVVLKSPMLFTGWAIFRDIANLFFILILLFIAFGTIVRSQSYNLKNLLPKLIIAVFLINFSNVIAGAIIDFGNIFMYGIFKWMNCVSDDQCVGFYDGLMKVVWQFYNTYGLREGLSASAEATVGIIVATIYTFLYGLILLALGTFLLIRIAAFALLIILSPLAFIGEVFPGLQELSSKWWKNLVNYTLFGPIFALLLYVSYLMTQQAIAVSVPGAFSDPKLGLGTFGELYVVIIQNIIPLIFLIAIIPITQELGIAGANAVLGSTVLAGAGFLAGASRFAGGAIDRWMARGAQPGHGRGRQALSLVSPGAWKRALKAHSAEAEHDYDVAAGQQREHIIERVTDWPGRKGLAKSGVKHKKIAAERQAREAVKAEGIDSSDDMIDSVKRGIKTGEDQETLKVKLKFIAAEDGIDDLLERSINPATGLKYGKGAFALKKYIDNTFKNVSDEEKSKLHTAIAKSERKSGNVSYEGVGDSHFDAAQDQIVYTVNPMTTTADFQRQEEEQVKAGNKLDVKDLKKGSFIDEGGKIYKAGKRLLADMKGKRAERIKTMDRERVEELNKALNLEFGSFTNLISGAGSTNPAAAALATSDPQLHADLVNAWNQIKTQHPGLP